MVALSDEASHVSAGSSEGEAQPSSLIRGVVDNETIAAKETKPSLPTTPTVDTVQDAFDNEKPRDDNNYATLRSNGSHHADNSETGHQTASAKQFLLPPDRYNDFAHDEYASASRDLLSSPTASHAGLGFGSLDIIIENDRRADTTTKDGP